MNFTIGSIGHSFHGAGLYYLHDKKPEDMAAHPTTSERVAWAETRNLMDVGPHTAVRRMIDTAARADELKAAAGVKAGGRKAGGAVFTFSLNWHPDELPNRDRATMIRAAEGALKTLGLDHLQCLMVCHNDEPQPHVHLIVNRVDFQNGKTTPIDKARYHHLDEFCHLTTAPEYRHLSPDRAAKYAAREQAQKLEPDLAKRKEYTREKRVELDAQPARTDKQKLHRETKTLRQKQQGERRAANARPQRRDVIDTAAIKRTWQDETRPQREGMGIRHKGEWRQFGQIERGMLGGLVNAIMLTERAQVGKSAFWNTVGQLWLGGRNLRADALRQLQRGERKLFNDRAYAGLIERYTAARKEAYAGKAREITERDTRKVMMGARHRDQYGPLLNQWKAHRAAKPAPTVVKAKNIWERAVRGEAPDPAAQSRTRQRWQDVASGRKIERKPYRKPDHGRDFDLDR